MLIESVSQLVERTLFETRFTIFLRRLKTKKRITTKELKSSVRERRERWKMEREISFRYFCSI